MSILEIASKLAAEVETAAPLAEGQYDWYTYTGSRGLKITNASGKRTVTLKNNSRFGIRPATSARGKARLITEELGPTIVFSFDTDTADKIISKARRANIRVTPKIQPKSVTPKTTTTKSKSKKAGTPTKLTQKAVKDVATTLAKKHKLPKPKFRTHKKKPSGISVVYINLGKGLVRKDINPFIVAMAEKFGLPKNRFEAYKDIDTYNVSIEIK